MNAVIQKAVIPAIPLYLLTLLQSMDAGRSSDFKESAHGYYYQYLLSQAFHDSNVKPDKLTELFQYSACLAWEFHLQDKPYLSESELRSFNTKFNDKWHTVDFMDRLTVLLNSRVLFKTGEEYGFRYPYIFYFLKGLYLSENLTDLSVRSYIEHCCQHLYVRDNSNTVLFLAHHSNDDFVLRSIANVLHNLFHGRSAVKFDGMDTIAISKLIQDAPKLTYSGEKPTEHRARRNEIKDELDDDHDNLLEEEEDGDELSPFAKMTMLVKTTEILGQVLKNQYSKIERRRKEELLEDLFNGPLRAIRDFYDFCEKYPGHLVSEIETALQKKGKQRSAVERKAFARKVVASLIQMVTFGLIMRASQSANSESLSEDVKGVVNKTNTPAFKLIELGIQLDSPKPISRGSLKLLFNEVKNDLVANRVIQFMVLNKLRRFYSRLSEGRVLIDFVHLLCICDVKCLYQLIFLKK